MNNRMKKLLTSTAVAMTLASAAATGTFAQTAPASPYIDGIENAVRASDFIGKRVYITGNDTTGLGSGSYADADSGWEDAGEINRTMVFKNFNRTDYQALTQQIQRRSKSSDVNQAFSYFDLGNGHDVNLIFDMRKSINTLVVIYIKKSLSHAK